MTIKTWGDLFQEECTARELERGHQWRAAAIKWREIKAAMGDANTDMYERDARACDLVADKLEENNKPFREKVGRIKVTHTEQPLGTPEQQYHRVNSHIAELSGELRDKYARMVSMSAQLAIVLADTTEDYSVQLALASRDALVDNGYVQQAQSIQTEYAKRRIDEVRSQIAEVK